MDGAGAGQVAAPMNQRTLHSASARDVFIWEELFMSDAAAQESTSGRTDLPPLCKSEI